MSYALSNLLTDFLSILLIGSAIKLMDDVLDEEIDRLEGRETLAIRLGPAVVPYCMVLVALAVILNLPLALSLFFASYALGMFGDFLRILPTGVRGWVEAVVILFLGIVLFGWHEMVTSLALIWCIQIADDLFDRRRDEGVGCYNLTHCLGIWESLGSLLLSFALAAWLSPVKSILCLSAGALLSLLFDQLEKEVKE